MFISLERDADLHMAQLMPLPLTVSCFSKIQIGFTFLVPAHPSSPGKRAVKRVCVCVSIWKTRKPFLKHTADPTHRVLQCCTAWRRTLQTRRGLVTNLFLQSFVISESETDIINVKKLISARLTLINCLLAVNKGRLFYNNYHYYQSMATVAKTHTRKQLTG